jgi:hypothetical protein
MRNWVDEKSMFNLIISTLKPNHTLDILDLDWLLVCLINQIVMCKEPVWGSLCVRSSRYLMIDLLLCFYSIVCYDCWLTLLIYLVLGECTSDWFIFLTWSFLEVLFVLSNLYWNWISFTLMLNKWMAKIEFLFLNQLIIKAMKTRQWPTYLVAYAFSESWGLILSLTMPFHF